MMQRDPVGMFCRNLAARFGDLGAPVALLGAWLAGLAPAGAVPRLARHFAIAALAVSVFLAMNTAGSVCSK